MQLEKEAGFIKNAALGLVILVVVIFMFRGFSGNPIEGTWENGETGMILEIQNDETAILTWTDSEEEIVVPYELGKEEKEITFMRNAEVMNTLADETISDEQEEEVEVLIDSFTYSIEGQELILSERDFGEQIVLTKVK